MAATVAKYYSFSQGAGQTHLARSKYFLLPDRQTFHLPYWRAAFNPKCVSQMELASWPLFLLTLSILVTYLPEPPVIPLSSHSSAVYSTPKQIKTEV